MRLSPVSRFPNYGGGGGGGTPGGGTACVVDGVEESCSTATMQQQTGVVAQCTNNTCEDVNSYGQWQQYRAFAGMAGAVNGYYSLWGAGSLAYTQDEAGISAANWGAWYTIQTNGIESGGNIWCGYGVCSSTITGQGYWGFMMDPNFNDIPNGTQGAAWWHSSVGPYMPGSDMSHVDDWNKEMGGSYSIYTGTTSGQVLLYGPTTGGGPCVLAGKDLPGGNYDPRCK